MAEQINSPKEKYKTPLSLSSFTDIYGRTNRETGVSITFWYGFYLNLSAALTNTSSLPMARIAR